MFYFDNAATTWPKPNSILKRVNEAVTQYGANPGRGAYSMAYDASQIILNARRELCRLFHTENPFEYVFTYNATDSLNIALKGFLKQGMHVVTTSLEHNSVLRPLYKLKERGIEVEVVYANKDGIISKDAILSAIKPNTALIVMTAASNVTGTRTPFEAVAKEIKSRGIKILVDGAQGAGHFDINLKDIDMFAASAHKGLFGLQGVGILYVKDAISLDTLREGGSGSESKSLIHPQMLPEGLEAGTPNTPGIASLLEGCKYISSVTIREIHRYESHLRRYFIDEVKSVGGIRIYGESTEEAYTTGVVSINIDGLTPDSIEHILDTKYKIAVRSGFHCAPLAHKSIGTYDEGTVRFSFSYFNDIKQIDYAISALHEIAESI
ncbi:MAG: aminotransferase class V-fold PLP-dependent enzyme [Clostridiales bacterium]|nr:aminotransferase class V-fold PLP-dependent enzyme [Clostridiales bacterium]